MRMTMPPADTGCLSDAGDVAATSSAPEFICMTLHDADINCKEFTATHLQHELGREFTAILCT